MTKDDVEAEKWYLLAEGDDFLSNRLTAAQRAESQRREEEWKPKIP